MRLLGHALVAICLVVAACAHRPAPGRDDAPQIRVDVEPSGKNAVSALARVTASGALRVWIEHGDTVSYVERTPEAPVSPEGRVTVPIIGLTPDAVTHLRASGRWPDGSTRSTPDITFRTGPLPAGVPAAIEIRRASEGLSGHVLVGLHHEAQRSYTAALVDRRGRVRWYWEAPKPIIPAVNFDRSGGQFVVVDGSSYTLYELGLTGEVTRARRYPPGRAQIDGHDFLVLPNGNAWILGWERRPFDTRKAFSGGVRAAIMYSHTVDELGPSGEVLFHWSSYDHFRPDEIPRTAELNPAEFESDHTNSIELLPDDSLLISQRATSSLWKVRRSDGAVVWRLGGALSDFAIVDDPWKGFSWQHDARRLDNGDILLFDNGHDHEPRESRVVAYRLDEGRRTATRTWEYRHEPPVYSRIGGSVRRLANGHTLIAWSPSLITEIDAGGSVVWEASTHPYALYRALFTPTLY